MLSSLKAITAPILTESDIVIIRQTVRAWAIELNCSLVDQTKVVTAASELARNALIYAGGGTFRLELIQAGLRRGLRLDFQDHGPGIADLEQALCDGFSSGSGMGLGLGGAKRLVDEFQIESTPGRGTSITIIKWK